MYRTIDTSFWTDPDVRKLAAAPKMLLLYLITNQHAHVGGVYYLPDVVVTHETGITADRLDTLWDTLSRPKPGQDRLGFVSRDKEREIVWVVNMLAYQGRGEKIIRSVAKHLKTLHNCPLIQDFLKQYPKVKRFYRDRVSDTPSGAGSNWHTGTGTGTGDINSANAELWGGGAADQSKGDAAESDQPGKKTRKQASGEHHELIRAFCGGWKERYGVDYRFVEGRDGKHVKWLLDACERQLDEAKGIVRAYLADDDNWLIEQRHPLGVLVSRFNRYRVPATDSIGAMVDRALAKSNGGR